MAGALPRLARLRTSQHMMAAADAEGVKPRKPTLQFPEKSCISPSTGDRQNR
jgi:hypothetical protein